MTISNTQIDRLGDRLRSKEIADEDLKLLNDYRLSFSPVYEMVVETLRNTLKLEPTGRPAKSTNSISDKLRRESLRLKQMQDIAGCRVVVEDVLKQDEAVECLSRAFAEASVVDRRKTPSHGYRAVHVIVRQHGMPVEVQVRTELQHGWAQLSEKLSDVIDPSLKYGGGPDSLKFELLKFSEAVERVEGLERKILILSAESRSELAAEFVEIKREFKDMLEQLIEQGHLWEDE
jgi:ppGpp synthetase/RelA/SpoT-type nucleotidyltranferase